MKNNMTDNGPAGEGAEGGVWQARYEKNNRERVSGTARQE
jgi:hypothetical protein